MSNSIRDAFLQSANDQRMIIQISETKSEIARRIRSLKEMVHFTFVEFPKQNNCRIRFDVYQESKECIHELGAIGDEEYQAVMAALKFARRSREDNEDAIDMLLNGGEHDFSGYESSDEVSRYAEEEMFV
jgi:hypothetical protein